MSKSARKGRVFVDYLRNNRTSTSVEAYSIRARAGAPVSVPLGRDELPSARPSELGIDAVRAPLASGGADAWAAYWKARQTLPK